MAELILHKPLLPGETELDQVKKIIKKRKKVIEISHIRNLLGEPNYEKWPEFSAFPHYKEKKYSRKLKSKIITNLRMKERFKKHTRECKDLLKELLRYDPAKRISAKRALEHSYLSISSSHPPCHKTLLPTFPPQTSDHKYR